MAKSPEAQVEIEAYPDVPTRNSLARKKRIHERTQTVSSTHDLEVFSKELADSQYSLAFILVIAKRKIEYKPDGSLFTPKEAADFLINPLEYLKRIRHPIVIELDPPTTPNVQKGNKY